MRLVWTILFVVALINVLTKDHNVAAEEVNGPYLNHWAVEIEGGSERAEEVAAMYGFQVDRQFRSLPDHYLLKRSDVPHRSRRSAIHHTSKLTSDPRVKFVEQQHQKIREKRGKMYNRALADSLASSTGHMNDPDYLKQWYMSNDTVTENCGMCILKAWQEKVSGKGVCVTILDDGLEKDHLDLAANYNPKCSYDFNDDDADPSPRYDITNENKHGTRCGGEVAMVANNNLCGVGIAFDAGIGGLRILDGKVTDHVEGDSLSFTANVHIASASWGPNDDGKTLEGPGTLASKGINDAIVKGRDGKGTILVWAAGNGAHLGDNCNCDGYTSSIYTLSVSSASQHGSSPWYSEKCSSTMAATYSSGNRGDLKVVSADLHGKCTDEHTGTSAAAPMAAGIMALVLEKNPNLTWRDAQHLVAFTSNPENLAKEDGWYMNGVGLCVNHAFGFGLMNAAALVSMADPSRWENVGPQKICRVTSDHSNFPMKLTSGHFVEVHIKTDGCRGQEQEVNYLEHVQLVLTLEYSKRGNIFVELESPSGTVTPIMVERDHDRSKKGFDKWPLSSVHTWGEDPRGIWKLRVADRKNDHQEGFLKAVELIQYGTSEKPFYHDSLRDKKCPNDAKQPTLIDQKIEEDPMDELRKLFKNI